MKRKRDELHIKMKQYRDIRNSMNISILSWNSSREEIEELEVERIEFEKNLVMKSYGDRMNRMNTAKYGSSLRSPFQSLFVDSRLFLYLICILMRSISDRYIYDFLKALESIHAFV